MKSFREYLSESIKKFAYTESDISDMMMSLDGKFEVAMQKYRIKNETPSDYDDEGHGDEPIVDYWHFQFTGKDGKKYRFSSSQYFNKKKQYVEWSLDYEAKNKTWESVNELNFEGSADKFESKLGELQRKTEKFVNDNLKKSGF